MKTKHTPGPWKLGKRAGNPAIYGQHGAEIAEILHVLNDDWQQNAALISAAPDLLAACRDALAWIKATQPEEYGSRALGTIWGQLESAIAKAERSAP